MTVLAYDFAGADNEEGVKLTTDHLISKGHKHIGFVGGETGIVMDQRLDGYRQSRRFGY